MRTVEFEQFISIGYGIDAHKEVVVATIRNSSQNYQTKNFSTFTISLIALRDWGKSEKVSHIVMESTDIYWKVLFNILEWGFEIILVNIRHIKTYLS